MVIAMTERSGSLDTPVFTALVAEMQALKQRVMDLELQIQTKEIIENRILATTGARSMTAANIIIDNWARTLSSS